MPTPPHLLQRAARGSEPALDTLVRRRKERAYQLATSLRDGVVGWQLDEERPAEAVTPEALLARWEQVFALHRAVSALPLESRELLVLADLEGLELEQVAWLLDISEHEAKARLLQARAVLRDELLIDADDDA
jgi:DNA-directed RNA polymerase specialized sigma24 family protein